MDETPTASAPAARGRAPHRRSEAARLAVLHAADDLLVERGFGGVTIEGIAARAGVAKQTIYRWWPSKIEILLDTLIEDAGRHLSIPDTARTFHQRYLDPQRRSEREMLERGVARGELSDDLEIDATIDALCGPIVYRALTGTPIPRRFIGGLISASLGPHVTPKPR